MAGVVTQLTIRNMLDEAIKNQADKLYIIDPSDTDIDGVSVTFDAAVNSGDGAYIDLANSVLFDNLNSGTQIKYIELRNVSGNPLATWTLGTADTLSNPGSYTVTQFLIEIDAV